MGQAKGGQADSPGWGQIFRLFGTLGRAPAYVHLNCNMLEPGIIPTDYRVPSSFTLSQLHVICQALAKGELVGLEIAEFENAWEEGGNPATPKPQPDALKLLITRLGSQQIQGC